MIEMIKTIDVAEKVIHNAIEATALESDDHV